MKRMMIILMAASFSLAGFNSYAQCDDQLIAEVADALGEYNYLKDYKVWMPKAKKKNKLPPQVAYNIILNKGKKYRFLINYSEELPGELKFEMFHAKGGMVLTNYDGLSREYYNGVEFVCKATAMYTISVSFSDGQEGCGVVIVGFEEQKKNQYNEYFLRK